MKTRPVPGENKQVLASKDKPENSDYEKELSAFKLKHANEVSLLQTENQELNQKVKS